MIDLEKRRPPMRCSLNGVTITSRYNDPTDIEIMMRALMVLHHSVSEKIISIDCDTKATASYTIYCSATPSAGVQMQIEAAFIAAGGGHNGITLIDHKDMSFFSDPHWLCDRCGDHSAS